MNCTDLLRRPPQGGAEEEGVTEGAKQQVVKAAAPAGGVLGHQVASCPSTDTSSAPSGIQVMRCCLSGVDDESDVHHPAGRLITPPKIRAQHVNNQ